MEITRLTVLCRAKEIIQKTKNVFIEIQQYRKINKRCLVNEIDHTVFSTKNHELVRQTEDVSNTYKDRKTEFEHFTLIIYVIY